MPKTNVVRAFMVTTDYAEAAVLVWTESPSKAKAIAMGQMWLDGSEWNDLRCKRVPEADSYKDGPYVIGDEPTLSDLELLWKLGWCEVDGNSVPCAVCERYEWKQVPQSQLNEAHICKACSE